MQCHHNKSQQFERQKKMRGKGGSVAADPVATLLCKRIEIMPLYSDEWRSMKAILARGEMIGVHHMSILTQNDELALDSLVLSGSFRKPEAEFGPLACLAAPVTAQSDGTNLKPK